MMPYWHRAISDWQSQAVPKCIIRYAIILCKKYLEVFQEDV
jgi:hypothetical protein